MEKMDRLFFISRCNRRLFLKIGVSAATLALVGCAASAKSTWVCSNGICRGKGLTLTRIDDQNTDVAMDEAANRAAHDAGEFRDPLLTWGPGLSVGVHEMDEEHIKLIYLANALNDAIKAGNGNEVLTMIFRGLLAYTRTHFADEERLMAAHHYPDLPGHRVIHSNLVAQVIDLKRRFENGSQQISMEVMNFLRDWVKNHIQGDDKKYGIFMNARGIY